MKSHATRSPWSASQAPGGARAGTDVEEPSALGRLRTEQLLEQLTRGVVPPVRMFDLRHAAVLLDFHGSVRPDLPTMRQG